MFKSFLIVVLLVSCEMSIFAAPSEHDEEVGEEIVPGMWGRTPFIEHDSRKKLKYYLEHPNLPLIDIGTRIFKQITNENGYPVIMELGHLSKRLGSPEAPIYGFRVFAAQDARTNGVFKRPIFYQQNVQKFLESDKQQPLAFLIRSHVAGKEGKAPKKSPFLSATSSPRVAAAFANFLLEQHNSNNDGDGAGVYIIFLKQPDLIGERVLFPVQEFNRAEKLLRIRPSPFLKIKNFASGLEEYLYYGLIPRNDIVGAIRLGRLVTVTRDRRPEGVVGDIRFPLYQSKTAALIRLLNSDEIDALYQAMYQDAQQGAGQDFKSFIYSFNDSASSFNQIDKKQFYRLKCTGTGAYLDIDTGGGGPIRKAGKQGKIHNAAAVQTFDFSTEPEVCKELSPGKIFMPPKLPSEIHHGTN